MTTSRASWRLEAGRRLAQTGIELADRGIQHVLCSSSTRTVQTYEALGLRTPDGDPVPVEYMEALYLGSPDLIRQRIGEIPDEVTGLLVIGHSPGIPTLAAELAWATQPKEADQIQCWFLTSAVSEFELSEGWESLWESDGGARVGRHPAAQQVLIRSWSPATRGHPAHRPDRCK